MQPMVENFLTKPVITEKLCLTLPLLMSDEPKTAVFEIRSSGIFFGKCTFFAAALLAQIKAVIAFCPKENKFENEARR